MIDINGPYGKSWVSANTTTVPYTCPFCGGIKVEGFYIGDIVGKLCTCLPNFYTYKPVSIPSPNTYTTPREKVYLWTIKEDQTLDEYIKDKIREVLRQMVEETDKKIL